MAIKEQFEDRMRQDSLHSSHESAIGVVLSTSAVRAGYGKKEVLIDISFEMTAGNVVAMIGPNGSGKSTLLRTVFGLVPAWKGAITYEGLSCLKQKPPELIARGLVYVPQGNQVFGDLTVHDNLTVSLCGVKKFEIRERLDKMAELFPAVRQFMRNRAGNLSGGEKQQVALATALMKKPRMLLLDEPSLGLSPNLLGNMFEQLDQINRQLSVTMLIAEHKVREVFKIADWVLGLRRGEIVEQGKPETIDDTKLKDLFLG